MSREALLKRLDAVKERLGKTKAAFQEIIEELGAIDKELTALEEAAKGLVK